MKPFINSRFLIVFTLLSALNSFACKNTHTESRADTTLSWFKDAKFGMFIHFQAPKEGEFNPGINTTKEWARIAREAGMKYLVLTTKHMNFIPLMESSLSDADITDRTSFKRDLVKELNAACMAEGLRMGSYFNIIDF